MQNESSLPPIFRTDTQQRLLAELLFDDGDRPRTLTDLAGAIGVQQTTVMREVNRLIGSGLLEERRIGRSRTVEIAEDNPFVEPLRQLFGAAEQDPDDEGPESGPRTRRRHPQRQERRRHERRPLPSSRTRS